MAAGVAALLWTAGVSVRLWPHALSYVNGPWGGTENGYRLVSDSNYDWGQGLKELTAWQRQRGIPELALWYFGTDPAARRPPFHPLPLHALGFESEADVAAAVRGRHLAVSTTALYGAHVNTSADLAVACLRRAPVRARTQTFLVFDFTGAPAPPLPPAPPGHGGCAGT